MMSSEDSLKPTTSKADGLVSRERPGVNAELPKLIKAMADRAIAAGHGGEQYPVLIEEFGRRSED
ncbi:hypothetical protein [Saccharomonospora piscinae]|uniref:imine reductase family protein n=1 Tax=Saccharomonospora piscinae TaxID=687388 RepID=UPI003CC5A892